MLASATGYFVRKSEYDVFKIYSIPNTLASRAHDLLREDFGELKRFNYVQLEDVEHRDMLAQPYMELLSLYDRTIRNLTVTVPTSEVPHEYARTHNVTDSILTYDYVDLCFARDNMCEYYAVPEMLDRTDYGHAAIAVPLHFRLYEDMTARVFPNVTYFMHITGEEERAPGSV